MSKNNKQDIREDIKKLNSNIKNVIILNDGSVLQIQYSGVAQNIFNKFKEDIMLKMAQKDWVKYFTEIIFIDVTI